MATATNVLATAHELYARATCTCPPEPDPNARPAAYKAVGISLAIASGLFIGTSFVLKKTGLLRANVKYNEEAGEGYGYLKNAYWWTGMTLMIIGEICNFVAYAFVDAILVTPLGALSVVITTILSAIFLKERLSFVGKIGCFMCIIGSVVIVMNAPGQSSAKDIQEMKHFVIAPGFLTYAGVIIVGCAFIAFWAGPRYGKKSMLVYLSICSLIGGLSVVATQGLGAAVVAQAAGHAQFNQWFLYVLFVFVIATLVTEIIFLNKALNIFNAALVTPTYYVYFTSSTIITSAILFRGFKGTPTSIITVVMGFFQICAGVVLLQLSKSAKDVPDTAVFTGDLDQVRTVAEQEEPESEPKADAIRGTAAIIRRLSTSRKKMEAAEAKRVHEERLKDQMDPIGENEQVEWDGLRRRKTLRASDPTGLHRRKTLHPPLGLTHFPDEDDGLSRPSSAGIDGDAVGFNGGFMNSLKKRAQTTMRNTSSDGKPETRYSAHPLSHTETTLPAYTTEDTAFSDHHDGPMEMSHVFGLPKTLDHQLTDGSADSVHLTPPERHGKPIIWADDIENNRSHSNLVAPDVEARHCAKRQFSFQNVFHRHKHDGETAHGHARPTSRKGFGPRPGSRDRTVLPGTKNATEEERLGLVKGDSPARMPSPAYTGEDDWTYDVKRRSANVPGTASPIREEKESGEESEGNLKTTDAWKGSDSESDIEARYFKEWEAKGDDRGSGGGGAADAFI